mmetsp:Transcript_41364/g.109595  ORF Transcript_41364/g.109595 Transcript_41364/m.109595 type:complete len:89 (+) Transcript_41364:57-323(+)
MPERRINPADGETYLFEELQAAMDESVSMDQLQDYWNYEMEAVPGEGEGSDAVSLKQQVDDQDFRPITVWEQMLRLTQDYEHFKDLNK